MEKRTFFGLDITPRRELWAEIERLQEKVDLLLDEKGKNEQLLEQSKTLNTTYAHELSRIRKARENHESTLKAHIAKLHSERDEWREKYRALLEDTPARGKGGRFVRRNAAVDTPLFKEHKTRASEGTLDVAPCRYDETSSTGPFTCEE